MTFGLSNDEWQDLLLSVNVHRKQRRLTPAGAARLIERALQQTVADDLAAALGFESTTMLHKIRRLHELPPDLASVVHWGSRRGSLSMSTASELLRLEPEAAIREAFHVAVEHSLTRDEARQLVQIRQRSGKPIRESVAEALRTRPRAVRSELVIGSFITEQSVRAVTELGDEEASRWLRLQLARDVPQVVPRSLRIGDRRFSLLLSEDDGRVLRSVLGGESIESRLSELMGGALAC